MQGKASQTGEMWPHHKTQLHFKTTISPTTFILKNQSLGQEDKTREDHVHDLYVLQPSCSTIMEPWDQEGFLPALEVHLHLSHLSPVAQVRQH